MGNTRSQLFNESLGVPYSANGHHYSKTCLGGKPTTFIVMSRDIFYVRKLTSCAPSLSVTSVVKLKGAGLISRVYLGAFGINMLNLQFGHLYSKKVYGGKPTTFIVMSRDIFYVRKLTSCAPSLSVTSVVKLKGAGLISRVYLGAFGINMLILQVGHCYSKKCIDASQQLRS